MIPKLIIYQMVKYIDCLNGKNQHKSNELTPIGALNTLMRIKEKMK